MDWIGALKIEFAVEDGHVLRIGAASARLQVLHDRRVRTVRSPEFEPSRIGEGLKVKLVIERSEIFWIGTAVGSARIGIDQCRGGSVVAKQFPAVRAVVSHE